RKSLGPESTGNRVVELGAKIAQCVEETLAAKSVKRDQGSRSGVLERPGKFAWCRERADRSDERANLGGGECTDNPFRAVGDQQRNAVATLDADGKERPGEDIHPR